MKTYWDTSAFQRYRTLNLELRTSNLEKPGKATQSQIKATIKPPQSHILGIDSGVQSHLKATLRLHQSHPKATPKPPQGYTKATLRLHQSHTKANYSGYLKGWRARKPPVLPGSWP